MSPMRIVWFLVLLTVVGCSKSDDPNKPADKKPVEEMDDVEILAKIRIKEIEKALFLYQNRNGRYPDSLDELTHPPRGATPFLDDTRALTDPWGRRYQWAANGKHWDGVKPDIWTTTPDGKKISNWPRSAD